MNFIKTIITILCMLSTITIFSQTPNYVWAKSAGGSDRDAGLSVTIDIYGNIIAAGAFSSTSITFGSITLNNTQAGSFDFFLVKYDANGNALWAKNAGSIDVGSGISVKTDAAANIFVTGSFNTSTISFDTISLTNIQAGSPNMFIVKFNETGEAIWAKNPSGISMAYSLSTDANENIFATGSFYSPILNFSSNQLINTDTNGTSTDIFLVKYDTDGNVLWANSAGGDYEDLAYSVATDLSGNSFITGYFASTNINFNSINLINFQAGYDCIFLTKYDADGNEVWAKAAGGGIDYDDAYSVATDASGNTFITGRFNSDTINFDTIVLSNTSFYGDVFLAKYDLNGNIIWAKSASGNNTDFGWSIATNENGNIFMTGNFWSSTITFDSYTLNNNNSSGSDIFIVEFNSNGNALWAKSAGGNTDDYGVSIATDAYENIYVTGNFMSPTIALDTITLINSNNTGNYGEMYLTKLTPVLTSINESVNESLLLFPNPTKGNIFIQHDKSIIRSINVYDMIGRRIYTINNATPYITIDISSYPKGNYFISIITEQNLTKTFFVTNE